MLTGIKKPVVYVQRRWIGAAAAIGIWTGIWATGIAGAGPFDWDEPEDPAELVEARLIAQVNAIAPGETVYVGVHFEIAPEWHLYWKNNGDTGAPLSVTISGPESVEIGELLWPAPRRYPHDISVDYIYENAVTLLAPIRLKANASTDDIVQLSAKASWLVCKTECIFGEAELSLEIPVQEQVGEPSKDAELFTRARDRLPLSAEAGERRGLQTSWSGDELVIQVQGATGLVFFPLAPEMPQAMNLRDGGAVQGDEIRISYPADIQKAVMVSGVVEVITDDSHSVYYAVEVAPPGAM